MTADKKPGFGLFNGKSLRSQFLIVFTTLLLIPVLVILYDIFFASKSDEAMLREREEKLGGAIEKIVIPNIQDQINYYLERDALSTFITLSTIQKTFYLKKAFYETTKPLAYSNPGVRFGLYIPETGQIFVEGFLHEYRTLDETEQQAREERIKKEAKSGLIAVAASGQSLSRLTTSLNDETYEYLAPLYIESKLAAVVWADERLHPIFAQSRYFRLFTRYFTLFAVILGATGALLVIHNLTSGVAAIKEGLAMIEKDIHAQIPPLHGEPGEIARAVNRMAVSLAEKEKLEEELRRTERLAALGRLVTGVAHELRNPIGIIKTTVQLLEKELKNLNGAEEYIKIIYEQIHRQNRVIQELLDFGRPSKYMVQRASINSLLESILVFTSPILKQHNINLEKKFDPHMPVAELDAERIKQVFVNIILNAVQAMPGGGKLTITTSHDEHWANIEFSDTGTGIPPTELKSIFDPFYTTKEHGTGLGLSISHQIVSMHDGHINVNSVPGEGTTFQVQLPLKSARGESDGPQDIDCR